MKTSLTSCAHSSLCIWASVWNPESQQVLAVFPLLSPASQLCHLSEQISQDPWQVQEQIRNDAQKEKWKVCKTHPLLSGLLLKVWKEIKSGTGSLLLGKPDLVILT